MSKAQNMKCTVRRSKVIGKWRPELDTEQRNRHMMVARRGGIFPRDFIHSDGNRVSRNEKNNSVCACVCVYPPIKESSVENPSGSYTHLMTSHTHTHTHTHTHSRTLWVQNRFIFVSKLEVKVTQTKLTEPGGRRERGRDGQEGEGEGGGGEERGR